MKWEELTLVAFDTETSGPYPVAHEIVEMGAVKWKDGQVIDRFQQLIKPKVPMGEEVIKIHGITNEMVADAPAMEEVLPRFHQFLGDAAIMAHHAPFDLGFLVHDFEKQGLTIPRGPILCSSLLARAMILESPNHKLQTLIPVLGIPQGTAHRALDDAEACLRVGLECLRRVGPGQDLSVVQARQGKVLTWSQYFILRSGNQMLLDIRETIIKARDLEMVYQGGSIKTPRRVTPKGLVRNPDGDFLYGRCHIDGIDKRFYIGRIKDLAVL